MSKKYLRIEDVYNDYEIFDTKEELFKDILSSETSIDDIRVYEVEEVNLSLTLDIEKKE